MSKEELKKIAEKAIAAGLIKTTPTVAAIDKTAEQRTAEIEAQVGFRSNLGFITSTLLSKINIHMYSLLLMYVTRDHPSSLGFIQTLIERMAEYSKGEHSREMYIVLKSELAKFTCPKEDVPGNSDFTLFWGSVRRATALQIQKAKKAGSNRKFETFRATPSCHVRGVASRRLGHT